MIDQRGHGLLEHRHLLGLLLLLLDLLVRLDHALHVDAESHTHAGDDIANVDAGHDSLRAEGRGDRLQELTELGQVVATAQGLHAGHDDRLDGSLRQHRKLLLALHGEHDAVHQGQLELLGQDRVDATQSCFQLVGHVADLFGGHPFALALD